MRGQTSTVVLAFLLVWALNLKLAELPIFRRQNRADDSVAPQPQPTPINDDLERGTTGRLPESDDHGPKIPDMPTKLQWGQMVIGVCFPAVNTALQALHTPAPLPRTFPWFCLTFELAFFASLVSIYIRRRYEKASLIMEHLAVLFGATAFLLAISMPLLQNSDCRTNDRGTMVSRKYSDPSRGYSHNFLAVKLCLRGLREEQRTKEEVLDRMDLMDLQRSGK